MIYWFKIVERKAYRINSFRLVLIIEHRRHSAFRFTQWTTILRGRERAEQCTVSCASIAVCNLCIETWNLVQEWAYQQSPVCISTLHFRLSAALPASGVWIRRVLVPDGIPPILYNFKTTKHDQLQLLTDTAQPDFLYISVYL